jgi:hypothetical protein
MHVIRAIAACEVADARASPLGIAPSSPVVRAAVSFAGARVELETPAGVIPAGVDSALLATDT